MNLDIGCGYGYRGDVNVDLKHPCDIVADAHYLPFRAQAFTKAFLSHVVEHVADPVRVLDEALRVARFLEVRTPVSWHPYSYLGAGILWRFNAEWFRKYAKSRGLQISGKQRFDSERSFFWFGVELCIYLAHEPHNH